MLGFLYAVLFANGYYRAVTHLPVVQPGEEEEIRIQDRPAARLKTTGDPLQRDLANGIFKAGDGADKLIRSHKPDIVLHHPPYTTILYLRAKRTGDLLGGTAVFAKNGLLTYATTSFEVDTDEFQIVDFWGGVWWLHGEYFNTLDAGIDRWHRSYPNAVMAVCGAVVEPTLPFGGHKDKN